jgi:hypothetical protein
LFADIVSVYAFIPSAKVLLPRNSAIPAEVTKWFHTFEEGQKGITIEVVPMLSLHRNANFSQSRFLRVKIL